jgi:hypothetical protein
MEMYFNLNNQPERATRRNVLLVFLAISFGIIITSAVLIFGRAERPVWLYWFYFIYAIIMAISLYMQLKGGSILDLLGKAFIKIDDAGLVYKPGIFSRKVIYLRWDEIQELSVKLFEIMIKRDDEWISVNLEKLNDENLKSIKKIFQEKDQQESKRATEAAC